MDKNDELMQEVKGIVDKQREIADTLGTNSAQYKEFVEKIDKKMAEFDTANEKAVKEIEAERAKNEEMKERLKTLETLGAMGAASSEVNAATMKNDAHDVMNAMLKNDWVGFVGNPQNYQKAERVFTAMAKMDYRDSEGGEKMRRVVEDYGQKASADLLRSDIGELGGFLCPPEWSNELNKNMIEYSPIRMYARVKRTASKTYREPIRIGIPRAQRPGEARNSGANQSSNYGMNDFTPVRLTNTTGVTHDELMFNAYDLSREIMMDNAEAFSVTEGQEFFNGTGVEQGLGFTVDPNVPEFTTAGATITFDDMINITGQLKSGYAPMYMFNRRTLAYLRTLKDTNGRYLWNGPFGDAAAGSPATINGYRYSSDFIEFDDHDTANGFAILFADMQRFYQIVDRADMTIIRDEYTRKKEGVVEFTMNKWCFGKPKIHEAGIRMQRNG